MGFVGDPEFAESQRRAAEAVGLDRVGASREIAPMDAQNEIGSALIEDFRAILMPLKILIEPQRQRLDARAGRAVAQQYLFRQNVENMRHRSLRERAGRRADAERGADRADQFGTVQRVEMQRLDALLDQASALRHRETL